MAHDLSSAWLLTGYYQSTNGKNRTYFQTASKYQA